MLLCWNGFLLFANFFVVFESLFKLEFFVVLKVYLKGNYGTVLLSDGKKFLQFFAASKYSENAKIVYNTNL